jgi:hypothetical protein
VSRWLLVTICHGSSPVRLVNRTPPTLTCFDTSARRCLSLFTYLSVFVGSFPDWSGGHITFLYPTWLFLPPLGILSSLVRFYGDGRWGLLFTLAPFLQCSTMTAKLARVFEGRKGFSLVSFLWVWVGCAGDEHGVWGRGS